MKKRRVIAIHLLNDYSGSPFVFSQALEALQAESPEIHIFTATPTGKGFLHEVDGAFVHPIFYRASRDKVFAVANYLYSQLYLFGRMSLFLQRKDVVYINTSLPFGGALAAWLKGCKVVYHIHEISLRPSIFMRWLMIVVKITANKCLYASKYLRSRSAVKTKSKVVYNSLTHDFIRKAQSYNVSVGQPFRVLMISSLRKQKGILHYVSCAQQLAHLDFDLVLNATQQEIDEFFDGTALPLNLRLFPAQRNLHPFFASASLVVNLSIPGQCHETFGTTVLAAMYYKRPVIIPPVGGITELVSHGVQGYRLDSRNIATLVFRIKQLSENKELYEVMSTAAHRKACQYTPGLFRDEIVKIFSPLLHPGAVEASSGFFFQMQNN